MLYYIYSVAILDFCALSLWTFWLFPGSEGIRYPCPVGGMSADGAMMRGSGAMMHGGAGHGPPFLRGLRHTGAVGGGATMLGGAAPSFRRGQCPTLHGAIIGQVRREHLWHSGVGEGPLAQGVHVASASTRRSNTI